jgi:hypothetical protein
MNSDPSAPGPEAVPGTPALAPVPLLISVPEVTLVPPAVPRALGEAAGGKEFSHWSVGEFLSGLKGHLGPGLTHLVTAAIVLGLVAYGYITACRKGFKNVEQSLLNSELQLNRTYDRYTNENAVAAVLIPGTLPAELKSRLFEQARLSLALAKDYLHTIKELYKYYYACLFMAFLTGALSAIILVLTTKDGWKNANEQLIVVLAVLSVGAVYFGLAPSVFKYDANLESNKQAYVDCADIHGQILSYALSYKGGKSAKAPEVFIREIDQKLKDARKVPLGFDASKLASPSQLTKGITGSQ